MNELLKNAREFRGQDFRKSLKRRTFTYGFIAGIYFAVLALFTGLVMGALSGLIS